MHVLSDHSLYSRTVVTSNTRYDHAQCTVGPLGQLFVPPVTRISHRHVYMHAEIGSRAAIHRACPAPFADPLNQWLASQSKVDKAEGNQGLAGLRERESRSGHVGEGNDQGRGCCDRAGQTAKDRDAQHSPGQRMRRSGSKLLSRGKTGLEGEENICLVDSHGKDEKKIHGRTLAGHRAGVVAHSRRPTGASSEVGCRIRSAQAARSCPPVLP